MVTYIIKTRKGFENIAVNLIKERYDKEFQYILNPDSYFGTVIIECDNEDIEKVFKEIPEIEKYYKVDFEVETNFEKIVNCYDKLLDYLKDCNSFAVETKKRGNPGFNSIDVNIVLGAKLKEKTGKDIDLNHPDKIIHIEVFKNKTYFSIIPGDRARKYDPNKENARKLFKKIIIAQLPYLGEKKVCRKFGEAIGRAVQGFEIKELIIAPIGKVNAFELMEFIKGVQIGQNSRYEIQRRAYPFEIEKTEISVQDMYELIRDKKRKNRLIIITDPMGKEIKDVKENLKKDLKYAKEIIVFCGSREGIPKGIFKFADYVLDLAPHITYATEHAIPVALISLWNVYRNDEN